MEFSIEDMDYKSKLLHGKHIECEGFEIHQLKLSEIDKIGWKNYNKFTSLISYNKTEIMEVLRIVEEVSLYDFVILNIISDTTNQIKDLLLNLLMLIFKEEIYFSIEGYFLFKSGKIINQENFPKIIQIIKDQNAIKDREEKITTKKERDYKEMVRAAREKHKAYIKATGNTETDLLDLISSVASRHPSLNLLNIYELTVYQLIDQFKRLNMVDEYFISIDSLLAGADKKDVHLTHWSKKIMD